MLNKYGSDRQPPVSVIITFGDMSEMPTISVGSEMGKFRFDLVRPECSVPHLEAVYIHQSERRKFTVPL